MALPMQDEGAQEVGAAEEGRVQRGAAADDDVVAAAGAGVLAVDHELVGAEAALAGLVTEAPANDVIEIAGPDTFGLSDLALEILTANEDTRWISVDPDALYFDAHFDGEPLICDRPRLAPTRFDDWLREWIAFA